MAYIDYVVKDEHTLGYITQPYPDLMGVLAGDIVNGGHDHKNGGVTVTPGADNIRPATLADFARFRVSPNGHLLTLAMREEFYGFIRSMERLHNAGCTTTYSATENVTTWHVGSKVVGTSTGQVGASSEYRIINA